jgi:hypothetical protein
MITITIDKELAIEFTGALRRAANDAECASTNRDILARHRDQAEKDCVSIDALENIIRNAIDRA